MVIVHILSMSCKKSHHSITAASSWIKKGGSQQWRAVVKPEGVLCDRLWCALYAAVQYILWYPVSLSWNRYYLTKLDKMSSFHCFCRMQEHSSDLKWLMACHALSSSFCHTMRFVDCPSLNSPTSLGVVKWGTWISQMSSGPSGSIYIVEPTVN